MKRIYTLIVEYKGYDCRFDRSIEYRIGKKTVGNGYFFPNNARDLDFEFKNKHDRDEAIEVLKKTFKNIKIYKDEYDD